MMTNSQIDRLVSALDHERTLPLAERETTANDSAIEAALNLIRQGESLLDEGNLHRAVTCFSQLAWLVADSWSYSSQLAGELIEYSQNLKRREND
jgi:hypothetical protein